METEHHDGEEHSLIVDSEAAGTRLDVWLHGKFTDLSRTLLKRYIRESHVIVDGETAKPSTLLRDGSHAAAARNLRLHL